MWQVVIQIVLSLVSTAAGAAIVLVTHRLIGKRERNARLEVAKLAHFLSLADDLLSLHDETMGILNPNPELDHRIGVAHLRMCLLANEDIQDMYTAFILSCKRATTDVEKDAARKKLFEMIMRMRLSLGLTYG